MSIYVITSAQFNIWDFLRWIPYRYIFIRSSTVILDFLQHAGARVSIACP